MKKLLGLLGAVGLVATTSATVVSCGKKADDTSSVKFKNENDIKKGVLQVNVDEIKKLEFADDSKYKANEVVVSSNDTNKINLLVEHDVNGKAISFKGVKETGANKFVEITIKNKPEIKDRKEFTRIIKVQVVENAKKDVDLIDDSKNEFNKDGVLSLTNGDVKKLTIAFINTKIQINDLSIESTKNDKLEAKLEGTNKIKLTAKGVADDINVKIKNTKDSNKVVLEFKVNVKEKSADEVNDPQLNSKEIVFQPKKDANANIESQKLTVTNKDDFTSFEFKYVNGGNSDDKDKISIKPYNPQTGVIEFECPRTYRPNAVETLEYDLIAKKSNLTSNKPIKITVKVNAPLTS